MLAGNYATATCKRAKAHIAFQIANHRFEMKTIWTSVVTNFRTPQDSGSKSFNVNNFQVERNASLDTPLPTLVQPLLYSRFWQRTDASEVALAFFT